MWPPGEPEPIEDATVFRLELGERRFRFNRSDMSAVYETLPTDLGNLIRVELARFDDVGGSVFYELKVESLMRVLFMQKGNIRWGHPVQCHPMIQDHPAIRIYLSLHVDEHVLRNFRGAPPLREMFRPATIRQNAAHFQLEMGEQRISFNRSDMKVAYSNRATNLGNLIQVKLTRLDGVGGSIFYELRVVRYNLPLFTQKGYVDWGKYITCKPMIQDHHANEVHLSLYIENSVLGIQLAPAQQDSPPLSEGEQN